MPGRCLRLLFGISAILAGIFFAVVAVALAFVQDASSTSVTLSSGCSVLFIVIGLKLCRPGPIARPACAQADNFNFGDAETGAASALDPFLFDPSEGPAHRLVNIDSEGRIQMGVRTAADAKLAVKQLQVLKKALNDR